MPYHFDKIKEYIKLNDFNKLNKYLRYTIYTMEHITIIQLVIEYNNINMLEKILTHSKNINLVELLITSIKTENIPIFEKILEYFDISLINSDIINTALYTKNNYIINKILPLVNRNLINKHIIKTAIKNGDLPILNTILEIDNGDNLNTKLLEYVINKNSIEILTIVLRYINNFDITNYIINNVVVAKNIPVLELLLEYIAPINIEKNTIKYAILIRNIKILTKIIEKNNLIDTEIIEFAIKKNCNNEIFKKLLEFIREDTISHYMLDTAIKYGNLEFLSLLFIHSNYNKYLLDEEIMKLTIRRNDLNILNYILKYVSFNIFDYSVIKYALNRNKMLNRLLEFIFENEITLEINEISIARLNTLTQNYTQLSFNTINKLLFLTKNTIQTELINFRKLLIEQKIVITTVTLIPDLNSHIAIEKEFKLILNEKELLQNYNIQSISKLIQNFI